MQWFVTCLLLGALCKILDGKEILTWCVPISKASPNIRICFEWDLLVQFCWAFSLASCWFDVAEGFGSACITLEAQRQVLCSTPWRNATPTLLLPAVLQGQLAACGRAVLWGRRRSMASTSTFKIYFQHWFLVTKLYVPSHFPGDSKRTESTCVHYHGL